MVNPDFCKLAEAYGIPSMRVTKRAEIEQAVAFARSVDGPVLIEFQILAEEIVYPMVPAGNDLHNMIRRPKPGESQ
jgi:acetolactate synthase-1/2/3 large subunit